MERIPKKIHYCWVGGTNKPKSVQYCINTWKKYCPDYEIIEWNENNYDFFKNQYMKEAYDKKKWGFVPDYARLDIIYQYGGIYMDTDVELVASLDSLLENEAFLGFENTGNGKFYVNCGHGFGAVPNHPIIKAARDLYDNIHFENEDGTLNMIPSPQYTTQTLLEYGLVANNKDQQLDRVKIFASDVLCPKNFMTGKIKKTSRTVSIHHFTATWLDEEVKKALNHQQFLNNVFGKKIGKYILISESVVQKYGFPGILINFPGNLLKKVFQKLEIKIENQEYLYGLRRAQKARCGKDNPIILDTALESDNCGDQIIMENCLRQLSTITDISSYVHIPTHRHINCLEKKLLQKASYKILCGTNALSGHMKYYGLWKLGKDVAPFNNTVLMGVGFASDSEMFDEYSKELMQSILSNRYIHSVRDKFSERMLKKMGINNVIYTGCPTMWEITKELCDKIPCSKGNSVITTITDYNINPEMDKSMIEILCDEYRTVYIWIQGQHDLEYIKRLDVTERVIIVDNTLQAFDAILNQTDIDYVGTRLHAGIRALSYGHRTIVVSIDNRAREISIDTGLVTIERDYIKESLRNVVNKDFSTKIVMPQDNIKKWKDQFYNGFINNLDAFSVRL